VFITGATGYLGGALARRLVERGHRVRALVRPGSEAKLAEGCEAVPGDALDASSYQDRVAPADAPCDAFVQLVGTPKPAPVMHAYVRVRVECEHAIEVAGLVATILRPWYVIGPGHRWPLALKPAYSVLEAFPPTRASAIRLGFVTLEQTVAAMVEAIERPPRRTRILETEAIRKALW
jgi:uncharacterized protein YbjT (DUF2867 family)